MSDPAHPAARARREFVFKPGASRSGWPATVAAGLGLGLLLCGCSSSASSDGAPALPSEAASAAIPTTTQSFAPLPTPTVLAAPACTAEQVIVSTAGALSGTSFAGSVTLRAVDGATCSLRGAPGLDVVVRDGRGGRVVAAKVKLPAATGTTPPPSGRELILGRNVTVVFGYSWSATPAAGVSCPAVIGVRAHVPGIARAYSPALQAVGGGQADTVLCGAASVSPLARL